MSTKFQGVTQFSKRILSVVLILSVAVNCLFLVVPLFSMQVFDRVLSSESTDTLMLLVLIALFLLSVQSALDWLRGQIMLRVAYYLEQRAESLVLENELCGISVTRRSATRRTEGSAKNDLETVREALASPGIFALFDAPFIPLFLLVLYLMHPSIGHFVLAGAALLLVVAWLGFLYTKRLQKSASQHIQSFQVLAHDWLRNASVILSLGMSRRIADKWRTESVNATVDRASIKQAAILVSAIARYIRTVLQVGVLCISVLLVLDHQVSAGVLIAASMIMGRVLAPVEQSIHHWQAWMAAFQANRRLMALSHESGGEKLGLEPIQGQVQFDQVTIGGGGQAPALLESLNFTIEAGKTTVIIGPSGAGKSRLVEAMIGLTPVAFGEIRMDGASLRQYEADLLGQQIGYVPQRSALLAGTIGQNIGRFDSDASPEKIIEAAKQAGIHNHILSLPEGYQTLVGSVGIQLSAGHQQQVVLARALFGNPQLLVLDEPVNYSDATGRECLLTLLANRRKSGQTTILITQRHSLLKYVDTTFVLSERTIKKLGVETPVLQPSRSKEVA